MLLLLRLIQSAYAVGMKSQLGGFLKQAKNRVSDWSLWGKAIAY